MVGYLLSLILVFFTLMAIFTIDTELSRDSSSSINDDSVVETPQNPHCDNNQNDTEKDNESPNLEYTYNSLNELGNKIISFPELKSCIEDNFVCKKCFSKMNLSAVSRSKLMVRQQTYGIATVIQISCRNAHCVEIVSEQIDTSEEKHTVKNVVTNYKLLILMQMLGKGLKSIAIITALLGLHTSLGFYTT